MITNNSVNDRSEPANPEMTIAARWRALLAHLFVVPTESAQSALVSELSNPKKAIVVAFANAHAFNLSADSEGFFHSLHVADYLLRDGSGLLLLSLLMGQNPGLNLNGTDFIPKLLQSNAGKHFALYGTQEPFLSAAVLAALDYLPTPSKFTLLDGFQAEQVYAYEAQKDKPAVIILGMGMPKQERVAEHLRAVLDYPCLIVCGGAIIDFLGGKIRRAPSWVRYIGFEWLYRLIVEPRRLFNRYIVGNPVFLWRALRLRLGAR